MLAIRLSNRNEERLWEWVSMLETAQERMDELSNICQFYFSLYTWITCLFYYVLWFSSFIEISLLMFSHSVLSHSLQPHGLQHARLPCPPSPRACSNSGPSSRWCHPAISSSVIPFSCLQSFPASGYFPMSRLFTSGDQIIGASVTASVLPMDTQDWFPLG